MIRLNRFWYQPAGLCAGLLAPLGKLYAIYTARKLSGGARESVGVPVVCIGSLSAGAAGRIPAVISVIEHLRDKNHQVHVITCQDRKPSEDPVRVDPSVHTAAAVGDETLLLAAFAEVWIARDCAAAARMAVDTGATVLVLDDGFQNPALIHDHSIVVVDAEMGFGNGKCIPAGPLREPVEIGLARADAILSVGRPQAQIRFNSGRSGKLRIPHLTGALEPLQTGMKWSDGRYLAFAGIGHPERFFDTLRNLKANLVHAEALENHQALTTTLMRRLDADAVAKGAQLITTEKDAVRLPASFRQKVITLPVRLRYSNPEVLESILDSVPLA